MDERNMSADTKMIAKGVQERPVGVKTRKVNNE